MRIVCDNCGAKYQISDDKVRNKVFKIRCKKCQHVIVVRAGQKEPSAEAEPQQPPAQEEEETRIAGVPQGMQQQQPSEAIWYVVINRNQVGPMSKAEIKGHLDAGKIDGDTFAWAEGVTADWAKLSGIPQLSDLLAAPSQPEPAFQPAPSQPEPAPQAAVFSSAPAEPSGDVFMPDHGAAPAAREPDKKFRAAAPMDEPQDPRVSSSQQLRGQRNENSVLFSLDALGGGDDDFGAAKPKSAGAMEGSGLLDIAALGGGGGGGGGGDLFGGSDGGDPFGGGDHFAPVMGTVGAMPALVTRPRGPSPLVWALGALGGLGVIAGAIFGTLYVMKKEEPITPAPMAQPAPVAAPVAPIPA
ncbi:zinc-ribbon domain-containing protein, partial [Myxococcota bacterium]|nr:zinc-ribbon domain-containing protein [Myxococcota bacterium]